MHQGEKAIVVEGVYKNFKLPHMRKNSIKSIFTGVLSGKRSTGSFEVQHALKDVSFEIKKGEFFGIVGRNGSGKSTLLKILAGIYQPTKGKVAIGGKLVPFIELGVGFNPELTGRENVYLNGALLGFSVPEIENMYEEIVHFAELEKFMDQKLKNYSSGMQVRLAFSMAVRADADVLLVDEVLAVGDAEFQRKCFEYFKLLKKNKKTVVFVTHEMNAVREFCDRALLIDNSQVKSIGSPKMIAREYSQLFLDEQDAEFIHDSDDKRWGTKQAEYKNVAIEVDSDSVNLSVDVVAKEKVEELLFGIHFVAQDGTEVTATNNRMIMKDDIKIIPAGKTIKLHWKMLNILNDGKYSVTLTLVDSSGVTYDWFTGAAKFRVNRVERSTTNVLPPISVKVEE